MVGRRNDEKAQRRADEQAAKNRQKQEARRQRESDREERRQTRQATAAAKRQQILDDAATEREKYGIVISEEPCGGKSVRLLSKGYVQIYFLSRKNAKYERLKNVSAQTTGMSGVITITTDISTYVLRTSGKSQEDVDRILKTESKAKALLNELAVTKVTVVSQEKNVPTSNNGTKSGLADQLQKLSDLHDAGALTRDEFELAKSRLLGEK